jgi:hypothetical protein
MTTLSISTCVKAVLTPYADSLFAGNPLVEALPPVQDDLNLLRSIRYLPDFDSAQRDLPTDQRIRRVFELANVLVPLKRHLELCRQLDALMKMSYIGRAPRTAGSAAIAQSLYEQQQAGTAFHQKRTSHSPQLSSALIGVPGGGKTTVIARYLATIPEVIYHEAFGIYQVPYLFIEAPSDGSSVKGLSHAILRRLDQLIPGANYFHQFALRSRLGADALMRQVAHLMHVHCVGLLVVDEVQNLSNARKGSEVLMTELVSACNELKVALLFVGTYKAIKVLSKDFRQARRAAGFGISLWDRLPEKAVGTTSSEWREFVDIIWQYQWVRKPVPLTDRLASLIYSCCQGVIGIAVRLLISAQVHAMLDGTETLTESGIESVYESDFYMLHPMMNALREGDLTEINKYADLAPPDLGLMQAQFEMEAASKEQPINTTTSGHADFVPRLTQSLIAAGTAPEIATELAQRAAADPKPRTVAQALIECTRKAQPASRKRGRRNQTRPAPEDFPSGDYRVAIAAADASGTNVGDEMRDRGMALTAQEVWEGNLVGP